MKTIIKKPGGEIWCYGDVKWDSNFDVVCYDELHDSIILGLEDENGNPPKTWEEVVRLLNKNYNFKEIEQIEVC